MPLLQKKLDDWRNNFGRSIEEITKRKKEDNTHNVIIGWKRYIRATSEMVRCSAGISDLLSRPISLILASGTSCLKRFLWEKEDFHFLQH